MNEKQIKTWNTLRFGNKSPKLIRKYFTNMLIEPIKQNGFTFTGNHSDYKVIATPSKTNWFLYDKANDLAFLELKYIPAIRSCFVVHQEDYDFGIHIGWDTSQQQPYMFVANNYHNDDMFILTWDDDSANADSIANAFYNLFFDLVIDEFKYKNRKTKWLNKIHDDFYGI